MEWLQFDNGHCSHISLPLPEEGKEEISFTNQIKWMEKKISKASVKNVRKKKRKKI